jgi:hypothetical protein
MSSVLAVSSGSLIIYLCAFEGQGSQRKQPSKMRLPVVHAG